MAKLGESRRIGKLTRSRNVPSFFDESTESAKMTTTTTMSVVADVHTVASQNPDRQRRRGSDGNEHSDEKEARRRSSGITKVSSRASDAFRNRSSGNSSRDHSKHSSANDLTVESLDLIEELETTSKKTESPEEKPRRRKQWSTVAGLANDAEADAKKLPRKRWSKDTGVIRLPETKDTSPLIEDASRRPPPIPAPRSSVRSNATASYHFDNPAFVSENEDEVLRIETDHNRESTRIEMRRLSTRSDATIRSSGSSRKHRRDVADSDDRSSASRRDSTGEEQELSGTSAASFGKITDLRTSSSTSEARSVTSERKPRKPEATRDRSSEREERSLFKKKELPRDEIVASSARDADSAATRASTETRIRKKKKKRKRKEQEKDGVKEKGELRYVSVTIHRADVLAANYVTAKRPMVKVHIVETRTGSYLKSAASGRESAYLQPMITGKFDFKENRSMIPVWEEELIFEHDFDEIVELEGGDQVVILFEVIDLLSFAEASLSYDRVGKFPRDAIVCSAVLFFILMGKLDVMQRKEMNKCAVC